MKITSRDNSLLRWARAVRDGRQPESIFIEGMRLCEEALRSDPKIEAIIYSDQIARKPRALELIRQLERRAAKSASVSEKLLESIAYTKTPQGIVALAARPIMDQQKFTSLQPANPLLVIVHAINNPVNVGAIIRTAEAAGATGIIVTEGTADPFSPKSLRGAMGSTFRLPIWAPVDFKMAIAWCRERKTQTVCADVKAARSFTEIDWRRASAIILGSESNGLSPEEIEMADQVVRIPMKGATESLNVAVAAGIIMFEAARQR